MKKSDYGYKITDDVSFIKCPFSRPGYFTGVCAIFDETITLVDSGLAKSPEEAIFPYLKSVGRRPDEISKVVLTHGHGDHCDGVYTINKFSKVEVAVHKRDVPLINDPLLQARDLHRRFPGFFPFKAEPNHKPLDADILLEDGDRISVGKRELKVIHTPGHTAGSIVLLEEDLRLCICGDSIQGRGEGRPLLFYSSKEYEESVKKLIAEKIEVMVLGHPMPPFKKGVLYGEEVKTHLSESLKAIDELKAKVLEVLRSSDEALSLKELSQKIPEGRPSSIGCVLESLKASGEVERIEVSEGFLWKLK